MTVIKTNRNIYSIHAVMGWNKKMGTAVFNNENVPSHSALSSAFSNPTHIHGCVQTHTHRWINETHIWGSVEGKSVGAILSKCVSMDPLIGSKLDRIHHLNRTVLFICYHQRTCTCYHSCLAGQNWNQVMQVIRLVSTFHKIPLYHLNIWCDILLPFQLRSCSANQTLDSEAKAW